MGEQRLLEAVELWPEEQRLCAKAAEGRLLDLRSHRPEENDPVQGREWDPERRIRAQVLFQLLTGQGPILADSVVAVRLEGAQVVGRLNLGGWKLRCPLELSPLEDVQTPPATLIPRTTRRYDRGRHSLDRHASYAVTAWLDGPSGDVGSPTS